MQDIKKELDCLQKMINETLQVIDTLRLDRTVTHALFGM